MTQSAALHLAAELMLQHGLKGWSFKFNNARRRHGVCRYAKRTIELSRHILPLGEAHVRDTLLHEIAHALVPAKHGHDHVWRAKAREIGCNAQRCAPMALPVTPKYRGTCPACNKVILTHRRSKRACKRCCDAHNGGKYDPHFMFIWGANHD